MSHAPGAAPDLIGRGLAKLPPAPLVRRHRRVGNPRRLSLAGAGLIAAINLIPAAEAQTAGWNLYAGSSSVFVPFANGGTNTDLAHLPQIRLQSNNSQTTHDFVMDTGSVGIIATPDNYRPSSGAVLLGSGSQYYSSSNYYYVGKRYLDRVTILDANNNPVAEALVPVLQVESKRTCSGQHCTTDPLTTGVSMMGIGFGRSADSQPAPSFNPLLNLVSVATTPGAALQPLPSGWTMGYSVSRSGLTLGLSSESTAGAAFIKLLQDPAHSTASHSEWQQVPAQISVNGVAGSGNVLVDTGITGLILRAPAQAGLVLDPSVTGNQPVPTGTSIILLFPSQTTPQLASYDILIGDPANPLNPHDPFIRGNDRFFVNTGLHFLRGYDIFYDADNGYYGLRWTGNVSGQYGAVTPMLGLQGPVGLPNGFAAELPVYLVSDTSLSLGGAAAISGPISGPGGLSTTGGVLTVTGANSYTGGTTVNGGILAITADASMGGASGALALTSGTLRALADLSSARRVTLGGDGGTFDTNGFSVSLSGPISGSGGLTAMGGGTLTLTGVNDFLGDVSVNAATLAISGDSALGAASNQLLLNGAALSLGADVASARALVVADGGAVLNTAGHTLNLSGTNTFTGTVLKTGAGQLRMAGRTSGTSVVAVGEGQLSVDGTLNVGGLMVAPGAVLGGIGTIGAPTLVMGTLAPGNSPGTLTFTAPVALAPGATLLLNVDGTGSGNGAGNTSRLILKGTGSAFTAAGQLQPVLRGITGSATNAYAPALGQVLQVIQADGGVSGSFAGLTQPDGLAPGTRLDALYEPNALSLVVTPTSYGNLTATGLAQSPNQRAVGAALDNIRLVAGPRQDGDRAILFSALYPLPAQAIAPALDQLAGKTYGDVVLNNVEAQRLAMGAVSDQMAMLRGSASGPNSQAVEAGWGGSIWMRGLGQWSELGSNGTRGYSASTGGVAAGADIRLGGQWVAGGAIAYTGGSLNSRDGGRASMQALHIAGYTGWSQGSAFADLQLGASFSEDKVKRELSFLGSETRGTAWGDGVFAEGRVGTVLRTGNLRIEPALGLSVQYFGRSDVKENGPAAIALRVGSDGVTSLRSSVGVRVSQDMSLANGIKLTPAAHLGWRHEFADTATGSTAILSGFGQPFTAATSHTGRDALVTGAGIMAQLSSGLALYASYDADLRSRFSAQTVAAGLRYRW
ncbi:autotransporter outer membrane beta-barrel domain-containing protein [Roseomonas chloroacetimidivorans]|uniref:autotransporter outer membrane beta-barrel domain-containing protein n=1 Tax=Roseomonas chloroacetimidivorans TaxID=1766656 RepID=UPI003C70CBC7